MNRLTRRRKMLIAGCVFAAVVAGVACCGHADAAVMSVALLGGSDQLMSVSSGWGWSASSGDLNGIPPLAPGQEVLTGSYSGSLLSTGPGQYEGSRSMDNSEIVTFSTGSQVKTGGTGLYDESLSLFSVGAGAAAATCGVEALQADAANYTAVPYCESVITGTSYSVNDLVYRSQGSISQADDVIPDSLGFVVLSNGSGSGTFFARSGSMAGIGPSGELGYVNGVSEVLSVGGRFVMDGGVQWTSFSGAFGGE
ncbi:MAG: hypothetical protein A4E38_01326 [Methanoregulaceae archaeon PtaB.Bin108]|nr:MAG: hypothetical protein A4E38_01326 [Methanoregulaceae archaeon PtaB.Bin108]OPY45555.1 MAG: hypothetical protein A4E42_00748 [Methanoregulaceae archaeon PtaU1.Bin222]